MNTKINFMPTTTSGKLVVEGLKNSGYHAFEDDVIAFCYTENDDNAYISFNYMSTPVKFKVSDIDESELETDGIKVWRTWSYNG